MIPSSRCIIYVLIMPVPGLDPGIDAGILFVAMAVSSTAMMKE